MRNHGMVRPGSTLYFPFATYDKDDGSSITMTGLAVTDIEIYKDGSVTQRASDNGYTLLDTDGIDFDGLTGAHGFSVNLADNSTAGFYAAGSHYDVWVSTMTVDGVTITMLAGTFDIGYPAAILNTTIATLASQTSFTLTSGPAEDDALNGMWCLIHDVASGVQLGWAEILDYTGSTKTVVLAAGTTFTAAATDNISVMFPSPLQAAVTGSKITLTSGAVTLAAASVQAIWDALTSALSTANSIGKLIVDNLNATISSRMATFTLPTNFSALSITAGGLMDITQAAADKAWGTVSRTLTAFDAGFKTGYALSSAGVQAIWDALTSALTTVGSIGKLIVDNLNATVSSRATQTSVDEVPTNAELATSQGTADDATLTAIAALEAKVDTVDTVADAIKLQSDKLTFDAGNFLQVDVQKINAVVVIGTGISADKWRA